MNYKTYYMVTFISGDVPFYLHKTDNGFIKFSNACEGAWQFSSYEKAEDILMCCTNNNYFNQGHYEIIEVTPRRIGAYNKNGTIIEV